MIVDKVVKLVDQLKAEIIHNYNSKHLIASGKFGREIRTVSNGKHIQLLAPHYAVQMIRGRQPGRRPPLQVIKQWIKDKNRSTGANIPEGAAYAIAKKIGDEGITVPNKYNDGKTIAGVITRQRLQQFRYDIRKIIRVQILNILSK